MAYRHIRKSPRTLVPPVSIPYIRQTVGVTTADDVRPIHVTFMPQTPSGQTVEVTDIFLSRVEASELCAKLAIALREDDGQQSW
jgi:hypothetical protein